MMRIFLLCFQVEKEETVSRLAEMEQTFVLRGETAASQLSRVVDKSAPSGRPLLLHHNVPFVSCVVMFRLRFLQMEDGSLVALLRQLWWGVSGEERALPEGPRGQGEGGEQPQLPRCGQETL